MIDENITNKSSIIKSGKADVHNISFSPTPKITISSSGNTRKLVHTSFKQYTEMAKNADEEDNKVPAESAKSSAEDTLLLIERSGKHSEKMLRGFQKIAQDPGDKRLLLADLYLAEIIQADPLYGSVLKHIKEIYEDSRWTKEGASTKCKEHEEDKKEMLRLKETMKEERRKNEKLEQENKELTKEYERQGTLLESQKALVKDLRKQLADGAENQRKETTGPDKTQSLMKEINALYEENNKLTLITKKLREDIQQAKARETTLAKMLKSEAIVHGDKANELSSIKENKNASLMDRSVLVESKKENKRDSTVSKSLNKTMLEVGKKKVSIPKLDFSKLPQKKPTKITVIPSQSESQSKSKSKSQSSDSSTSLEPPAVPNKEGKRK